MLLKNELYQIRIDDMGVNGEGIGRLGDFTVFVDGGLPGELLEIKLIKLKKSYGYGKLIKILEPSTGRIQPECPVFPRCGGCALRHMEYSQQLNYKKKRVSDCLKRIGSLEQEVLDTIGMDQPFFYRNKAQYPIGPAGDACVTGFYAARSHNIVPVDNCLIQHPLNKDIISTVTGFLNAFSVIPYDELSHTGLVRHIVTRIGFATGEVMVCLVINGTTLSHQDLFVKEIINIPGISSIILNINTKKTNVIMGEESVVLWGNPYIVDYIGPLQFEISPRSFFQVNPVQTEILYELVVKMISSDQSNQTIIDAYCGIGTISLFLAPYAKKIYGVEVIPEAVDDAKRNALRNGITNVEFLCGEAENVLAELYSEREICADAIVIDPPRKGCDIGLLNTIKMMSPEKIVYVSCDPATLARDLRILCEGGYYHIEAVQPVDCFCWTGHVETVVLMSKRLKRMWNP